MRVFEHVADLESAVGTHIGHSGWRTVTQEQVDTFAEVTDDRQWIHVDQEQAEAGPFGGTIAHGYLTLSLVSAMAWEVYRVEGIRMAINYGANKVRFPSPVRVGSRLRAGVELVSVTAGVSGYQAVARVAVEIEGSEKPACVVDSVSLLVP